MAKGKSSATSGTRKKHAKKAAATTGQVEEPSVPKEKKAKGKEKKSKEPKKKVYIPPVKPAPVQPDPLDTLGIAQRLPPELLVVLRRLGKKDSITKRRALEDFQSGWIDKARSGETDTSVIAETVPVWLHHVPVLFLHPSRRIRLLAAGLHSSLLLLSDAVNSMLFYLREMAPSDQAGYIIGAWCMAAHDVDRQVSLQARQSWTKFVSLSPNISKSLVLDDALLLRLWEFLQRTLLDPSGVYSYVNPPQPVAPPPPPQKKGVPRPLPRKDDDSHVRAKSEEDEESEVDRKARLRIGAFGSVEWVLNAIVVREGSQIPSEFLDIFTNPALWSALYYGQTPPFVELESFGYNQPGVRMAAWSLLQTLLKTRKDSLLPVLSSAVLRSAWVEIDTLVMSAMWQPLLNFLRAYPSAWDIDARSPDEEDEEDGDASEDEDAPQNPGAKHASGTNKPSQAYREFLQFLELGCSGSPIEGYPTVFIILFTIPPSVIANSSPIPLQDFFVSFWAALDGRALSALNRAKASTEFLKALLDCLLLVSRSLRDRWSDTVPFLVPDSSSPEDATQRLVVEQVIRVWEELSSGHLKVDPGIAALALAQLFSGLQKIDDGLFQVAWEALTTTIKTQVNTAESAVSPMVSAVLQTLQDKVEKGSTTEIAARALIAEIVQTVVQQCGSILESEEAPATERVRSLVNILDTFGQVLFTDARLAKDVDETIRKHVNRLLSVSTQLLLAYLSHRKDEKHCQQLWQDILRAILTQPGDINVAFSPLLDAAENQRLPDYLKPETTSLDDLAGGLLTAALSGPKSSSEGQLLRRILSLPDRFITQSCWDSLAQILCSFFTMQLDDAFHNADAPLDVFDVPLYLLKAMFDHQQQRLLADGRQASLMPEVFLYGYFLPCFRSVSASQQTLARAMWERSLEVPDNPSYAQATLDRLVDIQEDCTAIPTAEHFIQLLRNCPGLNDDAIQTCLVPDDVSSRGLGTLYRQLPPIPHTPSLAVIDDTIPPSTLCTDGAPSVQVYDSAGLSKYARLAYFTLLYSLENLHVARERSWAARDFVALSIYAEDLLQLPSAKNSVFAPNTPRSTLLEIIAKVKHITAYLLAAPEDEDWFTCIARFVTDDLAPRKDVMGGLQCTLSTMIAESVSPQCGDNVRDARVVYRLLQHLVPAMTVEDARRWMLMARSIEKKAPGTTAPEMSIAIVRALALYAPETQPLVDYRNELAAGLLGVPSAKANTDGLAILRKLVATAPDPTSDVVFLKQQRAVNVMRVCREWVMAEEDVDDLEDDVVSEMTAVFLHLAPILQDLSGAHWEFIFDVLEDNLQNSSLRHSTTLVMLSRSLRLMISIQDLTSTNKALRGIWEPKEKVCLGLIRDLVATKINSDKMSGPLSACRKLALQIVQDLPETLLDETILPKMCHLVTDSSIEVQQMARQLLHDAARKYTEHLVIEVAVDSEVTVKAELPPELVELLQRSMDQDDLLESDDTTGYFLAWIIAFDLFENASLKVKVGYTEQLRGLDLVSGHLLPSVFTVLGLYNGIAKAFKLGIWGIDEYEFDYYAPDALVSLPLLAGHLYYRALLTTPSLIRSWLSDCRDRQLLGAVTSYTSSHFSPLIIRAELAQVRSGAEGAGDAGELADESLSIKVASAVNEVSAAYTIDEHQLEISVRLPPDYPLHGFEIRDSKHVGVPEERWRAWVLGMQQILSYRSGSIADGLNFFKKNVTSHFEGLGECAICYSIISAMDGSLPRKPCKTCKNRFHAGCLYKWFNTSHSSSCPLCRSDII